MQRGSITTRRSRWFPDGLALAKLELPRRDGSYQVAKRSYDMLHPIVVRTRVLCLLVGRWLLIAGIMHG